MGMNFDNILEKRLEIINKAYSKYPLELEIYGKKSRGIVTEINGKRKTIATGKAEELYTMLEGLMYGIDNLGKIFYKKR